MTKKQSKLEKTLKQIPQWIGSPISLAVHTAVFAMTFALLLLQIDLSVILLILTTAVSLEAIYLAIIIQWTVNEQGRHLRNVSEDIEDILEDTEELTEEET